MWFFIGGEGVVLVMNGAWRRGKRKHIKRYECGVQKWMRERSTRCVASVIMMLERRKEWQKNL